MKQKTVKKAIFINICLCEAQEKICFVVVKVGMKGFEPSISGPPDQHFNRTKLHPDS